MPYLVLPTASIILLHRDPREQWLLLGSFGVIAILELRELSEFGALFFSPNSSFVGNYDVCPHIASCHRQIYF